jgi:hypothetical protein
MRKTFQRFAVNHSVPAESQEVTVAFKLISESTVLKDQMK